MLGWIHIDRKLTEWEWYTDSHMVHLWMHLLLCANFEPKRWKGIVVERGQLVTGRKALSEATGISEQTIRTCLSRLVVCGAITITSTKQYSVITICKYDSYQVTESDIQPTIQPTTNQQLTTTKELKNNNILTTPRAYMCEDAKESLSQVTQWSEQVCMKCHIPPTQYPVMVAEFISEQECVCKQWESENDMRAHFFHWLNQKMAEQRKQQAKPSVQRNIETEREREEKSRELQRQYAEQKAKATPMPASIAKRLLNN